MTPFYEFTTEGHPEIKRGPFYGVTTYLCLSLIGITIMIIGFGWFWQAAACAIIVGISVFFLPTARWFCTSVIDQENVVRHPLVAAVTWPVWTAIFLTAVIFAGMIGDEDD